MFRTHSSPSNTQLSSPINSQIDIDSDDESEPVRSFETIAETAARFITTELPLQTRINFFQVVKSCWYQQTKSANFAQRDLTKIHQFIGDLLTHLKMSGTKSYPIVSVNAHIRDIHEFYKITNTNLSIADVDTTTNLIAKHYIERLEDIVPKFSKSDEEHFEIKTHQYYYGFTSTIVILRNNNPLIAIDFDASLEYQGSELERWIERRDLFFSTIGKFKAVQYWEIKGKPALVDVDKHIDIEIEKLMSQVLTPTVVPTDSHQVQSRFRFLATGTTAAISVDRPAHTFHL